MQIRHSLVRGQGCREQRFVHHFCDLSLPTKDLIPKRKIERAGLSYKDSGVDIDAGAELVRRIQKLNPSIGGFSGLVPFGEVQQGSNACAT